MIKMKTKFELTSGMLRDLDKCLEAGLEKRTSGYVSSCGTGQMKHYALEQDIYNFTRGKLRGLRAREYDLLREPEIVEDRLYRVMAYAEPESAELLNEEHQRDLIEIKNSVLRYRNASPLERLAMEAE